MRQPHFIFFVIIFLLKFNLFAQTTFDQNQFFQDPYMPFSDYQTPMEMMDEIFTKKIYKPEDISFRQEDLKPLHSLIVEVYDEFKKLYPKWTDNKQRPGFIVVRNDIKQWAAAQSTNYLNVEYSGISSGFIIFGKALMSVPLPRGAQALMVAHEMAHLFLFHGRGPHIGDHIRIQGIPNSKKPLIYEWLMLNHIVGWNHDPSLGGFSNSKLLDDHIDKLQSFDLPQCGSRLTPSYEALKNLRRKSYSQLRGETSYGSVPSKVETISTVRNLRIALNKCIESLPESRHDLVKLADWQKSQIRKYSLWPSQKADAFFSFKEILVLFKIINQRLFTIEEDLKGYPFYLYTTEDQADEVAASIAKSLGYEAEESGQMYLGFLKDPRLREICKTIITLGHTPERGNIRLKHHASCWRYNRHLEFYKTKTLVDGLE